MPLRPVVPPAMSVVALALVAAATGWWVRPAAGLVAVGVGAACLNGFRETGGSVLRPHPADAGVVGLLSAAWLSALLARTHRMRRADTMTVMERSRGLPRPPSRAVKPGGEVGHRLPYPGRIPGTPMSRPTGLVEPPAFCWDASAN